jgi:hypothetical protein
MNILTLSVVKYKEELYYEDIYETIYYVLPANYELNDVANYVLPANYELNDIAKDFYGKWYPREGFVDYLMENDVRLKDYSREVIEKSYLEIMYLNDMPLINFEIKK